VERRITEPAISTRRDPVLSRLVHGVAKLGNVLRNGAWTAARAEGLTPTQGQILVLLRSRGRKGLRLAAVAGELNITPATASDAVSALERKQLVSREPATDDRRAIDIRLTPDGRSLAYRAMQWSDFLADAFTDLTEHERGVMLRGLSKAMHSLQKDERLLPVRMCLSCAYFETDPASNEQRCAFGDFVINDIDLRVDCAAHVLAS
jgi:DNA-binding MarR family transcriptional regulator